MKEHRVRIAHHAVEKGTGRLVTVGLGSCVAIAIHDPLAKVGGLAHVLLPDAVRGHTIENRARFARTAVPLLLEEMQALGATGPYVAKLAGGAGLFGTTLSGSGRVGARNIEASRAALRAANVPIIAEDVGGASGRTVSFDVASGKLNVRVVRGGERVL
ncbi:MAG: chemotaxis protein CheD [Gemmatimonadales bacterium]